MRSIHASKRILENKSEFNYSESLSKHAIEVRSIHADVFYIRKKFKNP